MTNLEKMTWVAKCPDKKILQLYLNDLLPNAHALEIENHLLDCESCTMQVEREQEGENKAMVNKLDSAFYGKLNAQKKSSLFVSDDPKSIEELLQSFLQSAECMPVDAYELQIEETFRAAEFILLQPQKNEILKKHEIVFRWQELDIEVVNLIIENNQNRVLLRQKITNNSSVGLPSEIFSNGLYYFKLIANRKMLKLGKFYLYQ